MPITALDVHYTPARAPTRARAAAISFLNFTDPTPTETTTIHFDNPAPYTPGQFYLRELPCLLAAIRALRTPPTLLIVDAHVHLVSPDHPGLGAHLYNALQQSTPVIGVAKTPFHNSTAIPITRGQSQSPLYITAIGLDPHTAAQHIQSMHGPHRIPTLLKLADTLARQWG